MSRLGDRAVVDAGRAQFAHRTTATSGTEWNGRPKQRIQSLPVFVIDQLQDAFVVFRDAGLREPVFHIHGSLGGQFSLCGGLLDL